MEDMGFKDEVDGSRARDSSGDGAASQVRMGREMAHSETKAESSFSFTSEMWLGSKLQRHNLPGDRACQREEDFSSHTLQQVLKDNMSWCQLRKCCFPEDEWRSSLHKR